MSFPLELGNIGRPQETLKKIYDIFSHMDTIYERDGQTDVADRQQRPRLRIASRGKWC